MLNQDPAMAIKQNLRVGCAAEFLGDRIDAAGPSINLEQDCY